MFRITRDPSSGSLIQCLAKNYSNGSVVSVDMDVVGVMAAYLPVVLVCTALSREGLCVCVCTALSRDAPCVYCTVSRGTVCVLHCLERDCVCTALSRGTCNNSNCIYELCICASVG